VAVSDGFLVRGGKTATFKPVDATLIEDVVVVATLLLGAFVEASGDAIVVQQGINSRSTLAAGEQTVIDYETMNAARSGGALVIINASETVSLSLLATSAIVDNTEDGSAGSSGVGKIASVSTEPESMSNTADNGGVSSSTSLPEAESHSGSVRRSSIDSARGLSLFVLGLACVGML